MTSPDHLHQNGYVLLHRAIPSEWLAGLHSVFDAGVIPSLVPFSSVVFALPDLRPRLFTQSLGQGERWLGLMRAMKQLHKSRGFLDRA